MAQFYRHSGTAPLSGILRTLIMGISVATFLAIVYAFAIHYIPFVYLNLLMTFGFGAVVGWVVSREAKATRIRHGVLPALVGLVCGFAGLYVAWAADLVARIGVPQGQSPLIGLNPLVMASYITVFYENGMWGLGKQGGVVSGMPLAAIWLVEAAFIIGLAGRLPWNEFSGNVFCEACDNWTRVEKDVGRLQDVAGDELSRRVAAGEIAALKDVPKAAPDSMQFLRINLACCESCGETNALELERVTIKLDKEQKPTEKTSTLFNRLLISNAETELVRAAGKIEDPLPEEPIDVETDLPEETSRAEAETA
jgi:hypothetical protein